MILAAAQKTLAFSDSMGNRFTAVFGLIYNLFLLFYISMRTGFFYEQKRRATFGVFLMQVYFTAWQAVPLVGFLALAIGSIVIFNLSALSVLGDIGTIANLLIVVVVREMGPLIIALILIARSGTATAAEIGNMRVNGEIDALKVMAINPMTYIVFPRILNGIVSMVCLTFFFNLVALIGGFMTTRLFHDMAFSTYFEALAHSLSVGDVSLFIFKNVLNGISVFTIACYYGLQVKNSPHEVPQATTKAVISSILAIVITTVFATVVFYSRQLLKAIDL